MQSGMKIDNISQFLGHSNIRSTQIYTHLGACRTFDPSEVDEGI
jgi:site-specific recombinase XerD